MIGSTQALHQAIGVFQNNITTSLTFIAANSIDKITLGNVHDADADVANNFYKTN